MLAEGERRKKTALFSDKVRMEDGALVSRGPRPIRGASRFVPGDHGPFREVETIEMDEMAAPSTGDVQLQGGSGLFAMDDMDVDEAVAGANLQLKDERTVGDRPGFMQFNVTDLYKRAKEAARGGAADVDSPLIKSDARIKSPPGKRQRSTTKRDHRDVVLPGEGGASPPSEPPRPSSLPAKSSEVAARAIPATTSSFSGNKQPPPPLLNIPVPGGPPGAESGQSKPDFSGSAANSKDNIKPAGAGGPLSPVSGVLSSSIGSGDAAAFGLPPGQEHADHLSSRSNSVSGGQEIQNRARGGRAFASSRSRNIAGGTSGSASFTSSGSTSSHDAGSSANSSSNASSDTSDPELADQLQGSRELGSASSAAGSFEVSAFSQPLQKQRSPMGSLNLGDASLSWRRGGDVGADGIITAAPFIAALGDPQSAAGGVSGGGSASSGLGASPGGGIIRQSSSTKEEQQELPGRDTSSPTSGAGQDLLAPGGGLGSSAGKAKPPVSPSLAAWRADLDKRRAAEGLGPADQSRSKRVRGLLNLSPKKKIAETLKVFQQQDRLRGSGRGQHRGMQERETSEKSSTLSHQIVPRFSIRSPLRSLPGSGVMSPGDSSSSATAMMHEMTPGTTPRTPGGTLMLSNALAGSGGGDVASGARVESYPSGGERGGGHNLQGPSGGNLPPRSGSFSPLPGGTCSSPQDTKVEASQTQSLVGRALTGRLPGLSLFANIFDGGGSSVGGTCSRSQSQPVSATTSERKASLASSTANSSSAATYTSVGFVPPSTGFLSGGR
ncbi:unnamed protein product [Amoebophrya sp. A25]|nr:unnamed protein product [Amoebophrya sp. A25]|eukprot:GSA25T00020635001.1